ncbi:uncharacterized protein LOC127757974 [Oryza glaberrima]|uniref:uncharacterized protein LOC127757974 n=1 Tax=Oryza glaberrima TaxID=4538 RepID=UPI00224C5C97|nr:uncharacterized protein LOC127757974 [Oryza glaberrima]
MWQPSAGIGLTTPMSRMKEVLLQPPPMESTQTDTSTQEQPIISPMNWTNLMSGRSTKEETRFTPQAVQTKMQSKEMMLLLPRQQHMCMFLLLLLRQRKCSLPVYLIFTASPSVCYGRQHNNRGRRTSIRGRTS